LIEANLNVTDAEYQNEAFSSWFIEISTNPNYRIVWDGEESWLVIEEKTDEIFNNIAVWKEKWNVINPNEYDLQNGINYLKNLK
jgi:hypothetical protein